MSTKRRKQGSSVGLSWGRPEDRGPLLLLPLCSLGHSPSTWTRAWASMLPAGVLLTQRYHVPSYTSTLLIRKVPFLETSNRESCGTHYGTMGGLSPTSIFRGRRARGADPRGEPQKGILAPSRSQPHSHL